MKTNKALTKAAKSVAKQLQKMGLTVVSIGTIQNSKREFYSCLVKPSFSPYTNTFANALKEKGLPPVKISVKHCKG